MLVYKIGYIDVKIIGFTLATVDGVKIGMYESTDPGSLLGPSEMSIYDKLDDSPVQI